MKKLMLIILCLCLAACGKFNVQMKALPPITATATVAPTVTARPTATARQLTATVTATSIRPTNTVEAPPAFMLASIQMNDTRHGWGVDTQGRIVSTSNGGAVWINITPSEEPFSRRSLFALNEKIAWAASSQLENSHIVWRTLNGGESWQPSTPIPLGEGTHSLANLQFADASNGWMLVLSETNDQGSKMQLYSSKNGGADWERLESIREEMQLSYLPLTNNSMTLLDERGWLGGDWVQGEWLMLKTSDSGAHWNTDSFRIPTEQKGVTCDGSPITWVEAAAMAVEVICIKAKDAKYLYHHLFYLSKNTGAEWHSWAIPGDLISVTFQNINFGWLLVTSDDPKTSKLLSTRDGGDSWKTVSKVTWKQARLNFVSDKIGWAIADDGFGAAFFRTEDGGKTWVQVRPSVNR